MEAKLPDFCSLGTDDLLGLALGPEAMDESQDLVQPGVGASRGASQPWHEITPSGEPNDAPDPARTSIFAGHPGHISASAAIMTTQELDSELRHLPIDSEPQPEPFPIASASRVAATQSGVVAGAGHSSAVLRVLPGTLDTAALDAELRELPLETQDTDVNTDEGTHIDAVGSGQPQVEVEMATADAPEPQSFKTGGIDVGVGDVYTDSQELNDELRALPIESIMTDDIQPPSVVGVSQGGLTAPAPEGNFAVAATAAASAHYETHEPLDLATVLQREVHDLALPQHQPQHAPANRSEPSGWDAFDDLGGAGSFEEDLEDYLAAQAADAQQVAVQAPPPRQLQPPDLDNLDDLIAKLEDGGRAPTAKPSASTGAARGLDNSSARRSTIGTGRTGADATGPGGGSAARTWGPPGRSQETVQQDVARQAKRPRIGNRGRPTMAELFGSDEEDESAVKMASLEAAPGHRCPADAIGDDVRDCAKEEEEGTHSLRPLYFPPQRLASCIPDGIALPVTAASGERVYCRVAETTNGAGRGALTRAAVQQAGGDCGGGRRRRRGRSCLLEMPLTDMLRELEDRQLRAAVAESEREERRLQQQQHQPHRELFAEEQIEFPDMAGGVSTGAAVAEGAAAALRGPRGRRASGAAVRDSLAAGVGLEEESMLWVDKYAPRHFMSLLSDERTNRQVALWVKDWDECVFGRTGTAAGATGPGKGSATKCKVDSRPQHKVLLIGGPPGLGKTTLAHVVARHCGYHPYEINASDDRTASTLLTRIQDAVQMTAVLGGGRPNCVIVDEVDGATGGAETGGAVAALLKLVRAGEGATAVGGGGKAAAPEGDDDGDGSDGENEDVGAGRKAPAAKKHGGGRQTSQRRPLCRPIICICNDLYAPALRPLRDVARVFHFSAPASERLTARLVHICQAERLEADPAALRLLVERTDRDVRACLNTLQFLARRDSMAAAASGSQRTIEVKDIETLNIASKDTTQSAMDMWTLLLSTGSSGRKRNGGGHLGGGGTAFSQLNDVCNRLQDFGDYDLVLSGLHENLPRVRFMDINLNRTAEVEEAMGLADVVLRSSRRTGDFSCLRFVPPLLAKVRALAAQPERPRQLAWPRLGGEAARRASAAAQLVRSWASGRGTDASVMASHGITVMMLDLAPALRAVASQPPIRAVAPNMMTADEQAALRRTADIMLHYGLRYCFESPTPAGLQPLQLPEVVAPVSHNAIILGLTAEVQNNIAAAAVGDTDTARGFQRQIPQPYGGRGPSGGFQRGRGGHGQSNSYVQSRGPCGNTVGRGAAGGGPSQSAPIATGKAPFNPTRHVPLVPAIDTLYIFTAFRRQTAAGARTTVPHVVRQMISQQMEMEAIRRAEATRMVPSTSNGSSRLMAMVDSPGAGPEIAARAQGPLQPLPPQQQMAGRMPSPTEGKKSAATAGGFAGTKRKGTWMDAFKQQASAKARGGVGDGASAGATARQAARPASGVAGAGRSAGSPQGGVMAGGQDRLPFPVLYRFNEGYTNAVKRPLLMRELM